MSIDLERKLQGQLKAGEISGKQADEARKLIERSEHYRETYGKVVGADTQASSAEAATLEIPKVDRETYRRLTEALANLGWDFVARIEAESMGQRKEEDIKLAGKDQKIGYVNPSDKMRNVIPPKMEVAVNSKRPYPYIPDTAYLSTDDQLQKIKEEETNLKSQLPEGLRNLISMIMPDPSTQNQMDEQFQNKYGKPLHTNFFGRTNVETVPGRVAGAGRGDPTFRFFVFDWSRGDGSPHVVALPAVVLPQVLEG